MQINKLDNNQEIELEKNTLIVEKQNEFLDGILGKSINAAVDIGLRSILPDLIEDQIIEIKDNLLDYGLKDGIKKSIEDILNTGKSILGILTGDFKDISQMQLALQKGGVIDFASDLMDEIINKIYQKGIINNNVADMILNGKDTILSNLEENIENNFLNQTEQLETLEKHIYSWNQYYNKKDFEGMEKEYISIKEALENVVPLEKTVKEARKVETTHNLIKNNGQDFNLSQENLELLQKLV